MNIMHVTKKQINEFNQLNVFFSFLFLILLQQLLVDLEKRKIIQILKEKVIFFSPDPNGKQRSFNCFGNSGRKVISFGVQSVGGSIS